MKVAKTKLLQSINAKITGNKMPVDIRFADISFRELKDLETYRLLRATEYRIGVHLSSTVLIDDDLDTRDHKEKLKWSTTSIGRGIANEVYGELRDKLIQLAIQLKHEGKFGSPTHNMVEELLDMITYD
jgi:hypothetical protein